MQKLIQAKLITDEQMIEAIKAVQVEQGFNWANRFRVAEKLGMPEKVTLAKFRSMKRRGILDGCECGCRGDFCMKGEYV